MTYNKLKLSVYESYSNNEITYEETRHLIDKIDNMHIDSIVYEVTEAENAFIEKSLSVFTESADVDVLTEAAKTFGDKIKALWAKFKAWVKTVIDKIIGRKTKSKETKVVADPKLKDAMTDMSKATSKLKSARTAAEIAAALAAVAAATIGIKKYNKLKVENSTLSASLSTSNHKNDKLASEISDLKNEFKSAKGKYDKLKSQKDSLEGQLKGARDDYANICEQNKTLIQELQEATDVAAKRLETIHGLGEKITTKDSSIRSLEQQLDQKKKELEKVKATSSALSDQLLQAKNYNSSLSKSGAEKTAKINKLKNDLDKQKTVNRTMSSRLVKSEADNDAVKKQNLEKKAKIRQLTSEISDLQKKLDTVKSEAKSREAKLSTEKDLADAKIKQMTPSYLMGVASQAIRALESTTMLPEKSTATIDAETKAKETAKAAADAKAKQDAEDLEKYKNSANSKYIDAANSKMDDFNNHVKKKAASATRAVDNSAKSRADNSEREMNTKMDELKKMLGMM